MTIFLIVLFSILGIAQACVTYFFFYRNKRVHALHVDMLDDVSRYADEDITAGRPWQWRYEALASVTYHQKVMSFKPIKAESFYQDTAFLRSGEPVAVIPPLVIEEDTL